MSGWEAVAAIAGLAVITVLTRGFFILPEREPPLPGWLKEGLRHAPVSALVAVIAPDLLMNQGQLISTWQDARLAGVLAATAWYAWRRELLGTIVVGTGTMLIFRLAWGW